MTYAATKIKRCNNGKVKNSYGVCTGRTLERRQGKCSQCGKGATHGIRCRTHLLIELLRKNSKQKKGDYTMALKGKELKEMAEKLEKKLVNQKFKCFYTGLPIDLGKNASLDHIFPVSSNPEKVSDIDNLVWVDKRINYLKSSMQPKEFYNFMMSLKIGIQHLEENEEFKIIMEKL